MTRPSEPSLAGTNVLDGRAAFVELVGKALFDAAVRTLPAVEADLYDEATALSWVPIRIVDQVLHAVAHAARRDAITLNAQASRAAVERTVRTVWRPFLRLTSDEALLARAPLLYKKSFSHGVLVAEVPAPKLARLTLTEWPAISDLQVAGIGAGVAAVLSVAGRKEVTVTSARTPQGAAYRVTHR